MTWTVNDILKLVQKLTRKNQSGSISAEDLFYMWNSEQLMYFNDIIGRWEARSNGKSGQNTGLILNETILTDLAPFIIPTSLTVTDGRADKPSGFEYMLALRINEKKVYLIRPDQVASVNDSVIDPPSVADDKYYVTEYEDYYSVLPSTVTSLSLDYIVAPEDIKWAFTFDSDNRQVYNPGLSVQPKWANTTIVTITKRTLDNFGVSWKDTDFINYGKSAQASGN